MNKVYETLILSVLAISILTDWETSRDYVRFDLSVEGNLHAHLWAMKDGTYDFVVRNDKVERISISLIEQSETIQRQIDIMKLAFV